MLSRPIVTDILTLWDSLPLYNWPYYHWYRQLHLSKSILSLDPNQFSFRDTPVRACAAPPLWPVLFMSGFVVLYYLTSGLTALYMLNHFFSTYLSTFKYQKYSVYLSTSVLPCVRSKPELLSMRVGVSELESFLLFLILTLEPMHSLAVALLQLTILIF